MMRLRINQSLVAAAVLLALGTPAFAQQAAQTSPMITTEGRASRSVAPDQAWVTVTAESRAPQPAPAQRQTASAIDAVTKSLTAAGIAADAIKTSSYTVEPQMQYNDGKSKVIGYIARQSLDVRVDDLTKLGTVIDAAGASGATSIGGIRYDLKDRRKLEAELLTEAVRDGVERARAMAAGTGREVLSVWRVDEQRYDNNMPRPVMMAKAGYADAAATNVTPTDLDIQARVSVTVILK